MRNVKPSPKLLSLIALLLLQSGCSIYDHFVSPGRIDRSELKAGIDTLKQACVEPFCHADSVEIIGHGGASYREYPMDFTGSGEMVGNTRHLFHIPAANLNCLIDQAFASGDIQAVEIDLQKAPDDHPLCDRNGECIYVMHNLIAWDKLRSQPDWPAVHYLKTNSMQDVLAHYLARKDSGPTELFLELKSEKGCTAPSDAGKRECTELSRRVAIEIRPYLKALENSRKRITFTSFSAAALQALHDSLDVHDRQRVGYTLVAGMNGISWFKQWVGQAKGFVPYFDESYQRFIVDTEWLDSIWFSPQGIPAFNTLFSDIYSKRAKTCETKTCRPLTFTVSSYQLAPSDFVGTMTAGTLYFPLAGITIDVEDKETPACRLDDK